MKGQLHIIILLVLAALVGCVEPIVFEVPNAESLLVVEGYVSNSEGPHQIKLTRAASIQSDTTIVIPEEGAAIELFEDRVKVADFVEVGEGNYEIPAGFISGQPGSSYHVEIRTAPGGRYRSLPDQLQEVGSIDSIKIEYEARTQLTPFGEVDANVLNVFVDAKAGPVESPLIRWRYTGIYRAETFPMLHMTEVVPYSPYKDPFPCSGYIVTEGPLGSGGLLLQVGPCECCECWGYIPEASPTLSDTELVKDGQFRNVRVGEVPIKPFVFYDKVMLKVEQMSISRATFDFFNLIKSQKENAQSIFQPANGELTGNLVSELSNDRVIGIFYATSIQTAVRFVDSTDVPYPIPEPTFITLPCAEVFDRATYELPELWE